MSKWNRRFLLVMGYLFMAFGVGDLVVLWNAGASFSLAILGGSGLDDTAAWIVVAMLYISDHLTHISRRGKT